MKNKILLTSVFALAMSNTVHAQYLVNISLGDSPIVFKDAGIKPDAIVNSFEADKEKISVGDTSTFTWNVSNAESVTLNGESVNKTSGSKQIVFPTVGDFTYELQTTSRSGTIAYSPTKTIEVYNEPLITSFSANPVVSDAGQSVTLAFDSSYSVYNEIDGIDMHSNSTYIVNPTTTTTYTLVAKNPANKTTTKTVTVTVQGWSPTTSIYGNWSSISGKFLYGCGVWSPDPNTVTINTIITQNATCSTDQTRTRQDRVISNVTSEIKNSGSIINETQTISQAASRPYGITLSGWSGSTVSSCAAWTPDSSTVNSGQSFTQTGVSCSLPQSRTRTENYIDHVSGENIMVSVVPQNQTVTVSGAGYINGTRTATGTKTLP